MLEDLVRRFMLSTLGQSAFARLLDLGLSPREADKALVAIATAAATTAFPATASSRLGAALQGPLEAVRADGERTTRPEPLAVALSASTGLNLSLATAAVSIGLPEAFLFLRSHAR
jgi:hypothetical protein